MRYSQPRKLKTRRGQLKSEHNPYCLIHRTPMKKQGKSWVCIGHWSTVAHAVSKNRQFAAASLSITGKVKRFAGGRAAYPWCLRCEIRMTRASRNLKRHQSVHYICQNCQQSCLAEYKSLSERRERERQCLTLLNEGHPVSYIRRTLRMSTVTIAKIRGAATPKLCDCGQIKHHLTRCKLRPAYRGIKTEQRSEFDRQLYRISQVHVLRGLPQEVRDDVAQAMLLDVMEHMEQTLKRAPDYLRKHNQWYSRIHANVDLSAPKVLKMEG